VDDYDFENENDISQFCPNAAEGQDAEYALDNPGKSYILSKDQETRQFWGRGEGGSNTSTKKP
jgi:hypothetical protein